MAIHKMIRLRIDKRNIETARLNDEHPRPPAHKHKHNANTVVNLQIKRNINYRDKGSVLL